MFGLATSVWWTASNLCTPSVSTSQALKSMSYG
jgi:hypothetical protein